MRSKIKNTEGIYISKQKQTTMAIHNQIFHAYRDRKQKIDEAINYLEENDYIVVHKDNLKKLAK